MADWRQIQARIRKAKNSPEALAKLSELYQRTRDAMVAWELGVVEEKAGRNEEAGKWYIIAAQRFRRADWKKKAEEALTRLGIELPAASSEASAPISVSSDARSEDRIEASVEPDEAPDPFNVRLPLALGEIPEDESEEADEVSRALPAANGGTAEAGTPEKKKRRRGRRGGRGRRRKGAAGAPGLPTQAFAESTESRPARPEPTPRPAFERRPMESPAPEYAAQRSQRPAPAERAVAAELPAPQLPSERAAHGRGDPALASRMAHLESLLRRLVGSPLHRLDEADEAPAGPGVFLLSDSDQVTSYYVEACQTLRIGLGNLARGGRGGGRSPRGGRGEFEGLKPKLAEHLGINESKVSQYMKDHCVVRWIQLDDEAPHLAHFAIGVLRTPLNVE
ncbi:MAG TPA: hypothetical protein VHX36_06175 [Candidatus Acidoferrales bacterium]|jgi:hypothetical protein|nr:hypothetical protein [Candidatus Acidoferrales bacterium]